MDRWMAGWTDDGTDGFVHGQLGGQKQLINRPTRATEISSTLIYHIYDYVSCPVNVLESHVSVSAVSDHCLKCCTWSKKVFKTHTRKHLSVTSRNYIKFNKDLVL